jgi:Zn-dependent oligopeptidase
MNKDELAGVPEHLCLNAQANAKAKGLEGYLFYLNQGHFFQCIFIII